MSNAESTAVKSPPRVVILGAGFAGINAAHGLRNTNCKVTVIDRNNFHTFQPLLYQVATAYLGAEEVGAAVRSIFRRQPNVGLRVGEVVGADWDKRVVQMQDGAEVPFDYLVVAGGSKVNYFGIPGLEEHAWPLYTLADAMLLRQELLFRLEESVRPSNQEHRDSTVVVVGGGPTGVETAGALASMAHDLLGAEAQKLHVVLVEAIPNLLNAFSERSQKVALEDLRKRGVDIRLNTAVKGADAEGVTLADGERIDTKIVVWAAGVSASGIGAAMGLETGRGGSVIVGPDLQVVGKPGVFAAGDIASIAPVPSSGQPPLLAPNAIQAGRHVGAQIRRLIDGRSTSAYKYRDKGILAVLGRGDAVAEVPLPVGDKGRRPLKFGGRLAWALWLGVHVVYLIGFRNRLKVMIDWGWNFLTSRGSSAIMLRSEDFSQRWWRDSKRRQDS
jgi:NADH:ubiquinone reductase (H+-translocating)